MTLYELMDILGENPNFSNKEIVRLAYALLCVKDESNPLFPTSPEVNISHPSSLALLQDLLSEKTKECRQCERCKTRTKPVSGDGFINADIFVLIDEPELIDDRTGIPLSGAYELKASDCPSCKNFSTCYSVYEYKTKPDIPCNFEALEDGSLEKKHNLSIPDPKISSPGRLFSRSIVAKTPEKFLANRYSWKAYLSKIFSDEEQRSYWIEELKKVPQLYVTSRVKCYGRGEYERARESCVYWLLLERSICKAPYTLVLTNREQELPGDSAIWGEVKVVKYPTKEEDMKEIAFAIRSFYPEEGE